MAQKIDGEIINADMGQLYQPLSIGTAKPDFSTTDIPHHLFDIINTPTNYTVTQYREDLLKKIENISSRNKKAIVVGGSSFYLSSLFFPPKLDNLIAPSVHTSNCDPKNLWNTLHSVDPVRAKNIHPNDAYRLNRALDIWYTTGQKPSEYKPEFESPLDSFLFLICIRDRAELYERINQRTRFMIEHGWIEEVEKLMQTPWQEFLLHKKIIGYDDIILYLQNDLAITKEELIERIAKKTRNYAKRQLIFLNMLQKKLKQHCAASLETYKVAEINLTNLDVDLYIKQLSEQVL